MKNIIVGFMLSLAMTNNGYCLFNVFEKKIKTKKAVNTTNPESLIGNWAEYSFMRNFKQGDTQKIESGKMKFEVLNFNKSTNKVTLKVDTLSSQTGLKTVDYIKIYYFRLATRESASSLLRNCEESGGRKLDVNVKSSGLMEGCCFTMGNKDSYSNIAAVPIWGVTDKESVNEVFNLINYGW